MKIVNLLIISFIFLHCEELQNSGKIGLKYEILNDIKDVKTLNFSNETKYKKKNFLFLTNLYAQKDFDDKKRSFININEAYIKYRFDNSFIIFGKEIKHWGSLEEYNIVDIFNINSNLIDPLEINKIGNLNFTYNYFFENDDSIEFISKFNETEDRYPSSNNPYYPFNDFEYESKFETQKGEDRPTISIKYNGYFENLDYSIIYSNGYDNQRDIKFISNNKINQYLYIVDKYMGHATYQKDNTLYKMEIAYTDIDNYQDISNYLQYGLGVEYTKDIDTYSFIFISEYYKYKQFNSEKKRVYGLNTIFQNDIFLSLNVNLNNQNSSSLIFSILKDLDYKDKKVLKSSYRQRISDDFNIDFSYSKVKEYIGSIEKVEAKLEFTF